MRPAERRPGPADGQASEADQDVNGWQMGKEKLEGYHGAAVYNEFDN